MWTLNPQHTNTPSTCVAPVVIDDVDSVDSIDGFF